MTAPDPGPARGAAARAWWLVFDARGSFVHFCLIAWQVALIPSLLLVLVAHLVFSTAGADVDALRKPPVDIASRNLLVATVLAPLIETLVLAVLLELIARFVTRRHAVAATLSALAWGGAHAAIHPMWFFGTVWSFYVFSRGYLAWRTVSYKHAFAAAAVPHALVNSSALLMQFFARN